MPFHNICWIGPGPAPVEGSTVAAVTATVGAAVAGTAATNTTPFGYTTNTQANDLVSRVNQLRADVIALTAAVNALRQRV